MQIKKRDNNLVAYDGSKIINVIVKSMKEGDTGVDTEIAEKIESDIYETLKKQNQIFTVEQVSDLIESKLMENGRYNTAKRFILYRERQKDSKVNIANYKYRFLTQDFLSKYKNTSEPFNSLGSFVFYRTYSRHLKDKGRRERWIETVARAVDYNCSLAPTTQKEAENLFDNMFYLRQTLSGRAMWASPVGGEANSGLSFFNCSASLINNFEDILDGFYLLLVGAGFGFRVLPEDVEKFPKIRSDIELISQNYVPKTSKRQEYTTTEHHSKEMMIVNVGDSRNAWIDGLRILFQVYTDIKYQSVQTVVFNYDNIRGVGLPIKGFGGKSSGATPYIAMIENINKILCKSKKIKTIDVVDIMNMIGMCVVSGNVRRSSEICLFDKKDQSILNAKSDLYKLVNGEWIMDKEIIHRQMSNNTILYKEKPTRPELHDHVEKMRYNGEPGLGSLSAMKKRHPDAELLNPCFTGDMKLLTTDGYVNFSELEDKFVDIVSFDGQISKGKVWCSGTKDTIKLRLSNGNIIKCTPNHVFMTVDGEECEAKDLLKKRIMPYYNSDNHIEEYVKLGFIQGDGCLTRLSSDYHKGIEVNIGENDNDVRILFENESFTTVGDRIIYLSNYNDKLKSLGFSNETLPNRIFPKLYDTFSQKEKSSFLKGCYSANGCVIKNHRVSYKVTCKQFAEELVETLLKNFKIKSYITTNKSKSVKFSNGDYVCRESYDVNIASIDDIIKFHNEIGFVHNYKKTDLVSLIKLKAPMITSITNGETEKVYDFNEPINHWGVVNGVVAHNCGEILILDNKGLCNLTSVNMLAFVNQDGSYNREDMLNAQKLSAKAGYRVTCLDLELPEWDYNQKKHRSLGCSLSGIQDFINATKISEKDLAQLFKELKDVAINESNKYALELGLNIPSLVTTIKPAGTSSQLFGESSGVHFSHSSHYIRRVRVSVNDPLLKVAEDMGLNVNNEIGQSEELGNLKTKVVDFYCKAPEGKTKYEVSAIEQLDFYKLIMEHYISHNCSITVHVRDNEWDGVEQWLWDNWDEVIAVSFISLDDSFYQLLPYESITKEEYESKKHLMDFKFTTDLISKYEKEVYEIAEDELGADCSSGACSIR